ncbi:MAG TPA: MiaB/RimO family radical SAM methylthiotransferase [Vicinamibacterales bacterium]|nr:MiaB/RimO family radical SAM methylthiotransferase [Vicinamibacterales bacterium]
MAAAASDPTALTSVASVFVGCKASQADGEQALAKLAAAGMHLAGRHDEADVVVVHTCCVTAEAEHKSRRLVRRHSRLGRRVIVAGCAARLHPEQFVGAGIEVSPTPDWAALAAAGTATGAQAVGLSSLRRPGAGGGGPREAASLGRRAAVAGSRTRLILKVQDGCDGQCSYCVVRLVRGAPHSMPLAEALAAARAGLARGCGEIVLSGIDLGAWSDGERRLPELVAALTGLPDLLRLRLSSLEPRHVDERLLEALAHPAVARHLHLPLQSADNAVLADMRRPYTFAQYMATVGQVRDRLGDGMLSTDVIVGFPTEDEAAFAHTLAALESGIFGRAHVFAFSSRPGTAAAALPPLPAAVVKERMTRALAAAEAAAKAARVAALGRVAEVLVENRRDGLCRGYSSEYIPYYLPDQASSGTLVRAVALHEHKDGVLGTVKEADR